MVKTLTSFTASFFAVLILAAVPVMAAKVGNSGGGTSAPLGNDISWPQCGKPLPSGQAFGIVGVNDGLANNTNPCFADELSWARSSVGGTGQPQAALYVNTANPGLLSLLWPTDNNYGGASVSNPYGTCTGAEDAACAYMYGYGRAWDDANIRSVPSPNSFLWWLDVETANSWSSTDLRANMADLRGMTDYFQSIGAKVGIYSTGYQWSQIVGTSTTGTSLDGLNSWIPGARTQKSAKTNCALLPLTSGGKVTVTQFVSRNLDYDNSCI